ncbi:hypothetical protein BH10PSE7_BH10PSE7_26840 [soil metagenome]
MQRKTGLLLGSGLAALIGLGTIAGIAHADRGPGAGWGGHGGHQGMHGMQGMRGMWKEMSERYDTNKDGKLDQAEIDANRTEWHAKFDTDKDNTLSLKEFEALWLEANRQQMVREFQRFDEDGDAKVTLEEYKEPLAHIVQNMDRNGDNFLSRDDRGRPDRHRQAPPPPPKQE